MSSNNQSIHTDTSGDPSQAAIKEAINPIVQGDKNNSNKPDSNGHKSQPQKRNMPFYTHCNVLGHTFEKCYKIHGYPPGYNKNYKGKEVTTNQIQTNNEGGTSYNDSSTLMP
uniref:Uncharacterized protein n=1 Tax=Cannabis sativa TaxID=3483 RepID=A0A803QQK6_CANSA